jgi:signal transduction histidine kinase
MIDLQTLRAMPLFAGLPEERWQWLRDNLIEVRAAAGEVLVHEGEASPGFFVLLEGEFVITKFADGQQVPVERRTAPTFFGGVALLTETLPLTTLKAETASCGIRLSEPVFHELLMCCQEFSKALFRSVAARYITVETLVHNREKMAALGVLAAGLAHELNNPASAVARAADRARQALDALNESAIAFSRCAIGAEALGVFDALSRRNAGAARLHGALQKSAEEQALGDWLADHGVARPWLAAPCLAGGGIARGDLEPLAAELNREQFNAGVRWLAATLELGSIMEQARSGATRISAIVKAMRSYSYMDQAPLQEVDIHEGIEDTLTIMHHKLKQGIAVKRDYDRSLPRLQVYGSELNQVWTNIIDNAADAMGGRGELTIRTRRDGDYAAVEITDDGPGIPAQIQPQIFQPFFTTKAPGQGTGLGLEIAYRIVTARHSGTIRVASQPGRTTFQICLPLSEDRKAPG